VLDDSYHIVTVDKQRELVVEHTASFVSRIGAKAAGKTADKRSAAA
jgi:carboxylesterase